MPDAKTDGTQDSKAESAAKSAAKSVVTDTSVDVEKIAAALLEKIVENMPTSTQSSARNEQEQKEQKQKEEIEGHLAEEPPVSVIFPPCADVLLAHIKTTKVAGEKDDITKYFDEYFEFSKQRIVPGVDEDKDEIPDILESMLDEKLITCLAGQGWPPFWCLPSPCVKLAGNRRLSSPPDSSPPAPASKIERLFIADVVWLFYFERMGIFKILGVILDDFATKGKFPISNGSIGSEIKDDVTAIILEAMVRQTRTGLSSTVRDRDSTYRRCLGWTSDIGRKLGIDAVVNTAFNNLFHKFIQNALEYYRDKTLATAIQATTTPRKPSVATLTTIGDTLTLLRKSFEAFKYGRNYSNTLSGIVWVIAGMALIREMRETLGIPPEYSSPEQYIPAAYDLLVMKRSITPAEANRYIIHKECANDARNILLDLQVLKHSNTNKLETWLGLVEDEIEGYRTAYRSLTGVDLGMAPPPGIPKIEQQV